MDDRQKAIKMYAFSYQKELVLKGENKKKKNAGVVKNILLSFPSDENGYFKKRH